MRNVERAAKQSRLHAAPIGRPRARYAGFKGNARLRWHSARFGSGGSGSWLISGVYFVSDASTMGLVGGIDRIEAEIGDGDLTAGEVG
jgi:hypothetical protein